MERDGRRKMTPANNEAANQYLTPLLLFQVIILLSCFIKDALFLSEPVYTQNENEVRRGLFPFMAYIYYSDKMVLDVTNLRFLRGAVLIRPNWLISSAIYTPDGQIGFPEKTLLARMGAISIDANFALNEDEDEQEQEVIEIVRPYGRSEAQWWYTDISLLKTLVPFNMTFAVTTMPSTSPKPQYSDKTCSILIFAKRSNVSDEKILMQFAMELLSPTEESCGDHFHNETMTCAIMASDENKIAVPSGFCQGNSGGPLVCDRHVFGIQTYIENNCRAPHLYQLLSAWSYFIKCGTEEKCHEKGCSKVCKVTNKDSPTTEYVYEAPTTEESKAVSFVLEETTAIQTESITAKIKDTTTRTDATESTMTTTSTQTSTEPSTETGTRTTEESLVTSRKVMLTEAQELRYVSSEPVEESTTLKKKFNEHRKKLDSAEDTLLKEQFVEPKSGKTKKRTKGAAERNNVCLFQSLLFTFLVLSCAI